VTHPLGSERGIALVAAAFVLVVIATLVAAVFFGALQEYRMGRNSAGERRAFDAAEAGLAQALHDLDAAGLDTLAVGDSTVFSGALGAGAGSYAGTVLRLSPQLLLVRSTGRDGGGSSERALAILARPGPMLRLPAALVSSGPVEIGPNGSVDGFDASPEGWDCPAGQDTAAGILMGDSALLHVAECGASDCVRGSPAVRVDSEIRGAGVPVLGEAGWAALLLRADTIGSGDGTSGGAGDSLPIVFVPGNLVLTGARSQGVLLVEGDVSLEEGSVFVGLVVARGRLTIGELGGRIVGAAVVAGAALGASSGGSSAAVVHSGCVVRRVISVIAGAHPLAERSWAAIY